MEQLQDTLLDGRYRLASPLGRGGMSIVYAAEDLELGRQVAVKLLLQDGDEILAERLFREARAAAASNHPAIVTVYAHGLDPQTGLCYLVMERLSGMDLQARLAREGALPIPLVQTIGVEVADVLSEVHTRGIVHRDLKPANIFLGHRGRHRDEIRLLDFGVAKQLGMMTLTRPGQLVGTWGYMAPEQLLEQPVDPRTDLYALGLVLYECLTGVRPFSGVSLPKLAQATLHHEVSPPQRARPDAPDSLCHLILGCLHREPDARIQSAAALRDALVAV